jgi:hypothetical protein
MSVISRSTVWSLPRNLAITRFRFDGAEAGKLRGLCCAAQGLDTRGAEATVAAEGMDVVAACGVEDRDDDASLEGGGNGPHPVTRTQTAATSHIRPRVITA